MAAPPAPAYLGKGIPSASRRGVTTHYWDRDAASYYFNINKRFPISYRVVAYIGEGEVGTTTPSDLIEDLISYEFLSNLLIAQAIRAFRDDEQQIFAEKPWQTSFVDAALPKPSAKHFKIGIVGISDERLESMPIDLFGVRHVWTDSWPTETQTKQLLLFYSSYIIYADFTS